MRFSEGFAAHCVDRCEDSFAHCRCGIVDFLPIWGRLDSEGALGAFDVLRWLTAGLALGGIVCFARRASDGGGNGRVEVVGGSFASIAFSFAQVAFAGASGIFLAWSCYQIFAFHAIRLILSSGFTFIGRAS